MRNLKTILFAAILCIACAACEKNDLGQETQREFFLNAGNEFSRDTTKTYIDNTNFGRDIKWSENDELSLYSEKSGVYKYKLKEGAGTTQGVFSTTSRPEFGEDAIYHALYPSTLVSDDKKTQTWPSEQTRAIDHPEIVSLPMFAEGDIENDTPADAMFTCLGGILDIILKVPENGTEGFLSKVVLEAGQKISGKFTIVDNGSGKKIAVIDQESGNSSLTYILDSNDGKGVFIRKGDESAIHLMISLPASPEEGYSGIKLSFYDENGKYINSVSPKGKLVIERAKVTQANVPFTHVYRPSLTVNDPVGTIGTLYGRDAIVVEIGGIKKALALYNEGVSADNPNGMINYLCFDGTLESPVELNDGWRLIYKDEWNMLAANYALAEYKEDVSAFKIADTIVEFPFSFPNWFGVFEYILADYHVVNKYQFNQAVPPKNGGSSCAASGPVRLIRELPVYPAVDPKHELTESDPVGSIGMCCGREAIVMNLRGYKVAIATKDLGATIPGQPGDDFVFDNYKNEIDCVFYGYQWDYDQLHLTDGWRVPTPQEWRELMDSSTHVWWYDGSDNTYNWSFNDQAVLKICASKYLTSESNYYMRIPLNPGDGIPDYLSLHGYFQHWKNETFQSCVRPIHDLEIRAIITKDSPVGTVGVVDGRECVVAEGYNGRKILLATVAPGPCASNGGGAKEGNGDAVLPHFDKYYRRGVWRSLFNARDDKKYGFWGQGWDIIEENDLRTLLTGENATTSFEQLDDETHGCFTVRIGGVYDWKIYAYGVIDNGWEDHDDTNFYYMYRRPLNSSTEYGFMVYYIVEHGVYYPIPAGTFEWNPLGEETHGCKWSYLTCLSHEMPE